MAVVLRDAQPFLIPDAKQELVGDPPEQKNWKGIAIALLVIASICGAIIGAIVGLRKTDDSVDHGRQVTLEDLFDSNYVPRAIEIQWLKTSTQDYAYIDGYGNLLRKRNSVDGVLETVLNNETLISKWADKAWLSPSERYVLLRTKVEKIRTHTTLAEYLVYDLKTRFFSTLKTSGTQLLQYAGWLTSNDSLVFVAQNDVYISWRPGDVGTKVSSGGAPMLVYNGIPDPMYEDEILRIGHAVWPAEGDNFIAYASFNDSLLPRHDYARYSPDDQYNPQLYSQPYPKAGLNSPNPAVTLWLVDLRGERSSGRSYKPATFKLPDQVAARDYYLTAVKWIDGIRVFTSWLERNFGSSVDCRCWATTGDCEVIRRTVSSAVGELEIRGGLAEPVFSADGSRYFITSRVKANANGEHFRRVESVFVDGRYEFLTFGQWDDIEVLAYEDTVGVLYYTSTGGDSRDRHLYSLLVDSPDQRRGCLTCDNPTCEYVDADFNADASLYMLACLGPAVPTYSVRRTAVDRMYESLEDNRALVERVARLAMPTITYHQLDLSGGGESQRAWVRLAKPVHHNADEIYKYGLIVRVPVSDHRTPATSSVSKRFSLDWDTFMASGRRRIVATIETRGSDNKGLKFAMGAYRRPGATEAADLAHLTQQIISNEKLDINKDSVSFVGDEYAAFIGLHSISIRDQPFACAALTSPITDLRHYYTAFSERLVGLLSDPATVQAYQAANVSRLMTGDTRVRLLLLHGMADDRVHFHNTASLMRVLQGLGTDHLSQLYPDQGSDLRASLTARHYYQALTSFISDCFRDDSEKNNLT